ncbi:MAG: hypothetical protein J6K42_06735 [Clostridia bacterium]|nr:hypothetical protein [Clostridia bacterium]
MEEEFDGKQYSSPCIVSFGIAIEILLLKIMDVLNFIEIMEIGFALFLDTCIASFIVGIIGLARYNKEKSKGKWMGIVGICLSIGLVLSEMEMIYLLVFEIFIAFIFFIHFLFKKISRKNKSQ